MSITNYSMPAPIVRAVAGAEFLDEHEPGWLDLVDEQYLDIAGIDECPLGQLGRHLDLDHSDAGEYCWVAVDKYGLDTEAMLQLGFAGEVDEIPSLNAAWVGVIYARRRLAKAAERAGVDDVEIVPAVLAVA